MNTIHYLLYTALASTALYYGFQDDNNQPIYGEKTGLPVNCRAYVQVVIDGYRSRQYTAEESMNGLERNCGINGQVWKNNR